nr:hypothetical protein CFP56_24585 [Quercus suber]
MWSRAHVITVTSTHALPARDDHGATLVGCDHLDGHQTPSLTQPNHGFTCTYQQHLHLDSRRIYQSYLFSSLSSVPRYTPSLLCYRLSCGVFVAVRKSKAGKETTKSSSDERLNSTSLSPRSRDLIPWDL